MNHWAQTVQTLCIQSEEILKVSSLLLDEQDVFESTLSVLEEQVLNAPWFDLIKALQPLSQGNFEPSKRLEDIHNILLTFIEQGKKEGQFEDKQLHVFCGAMIRARIWANEGYLHTQDFGFKQLFQLGDDWHNLHDGFLSDTLQDVIVQRIIHSECVRKKLREPYETLPEAASALPTRRL